MLSVSNFLIPPHKNNNSCKNLDSKKGAICTSSGVNVREKKSTYSRNIRNFI